MATGSKSDGVELISLTEGMDEVEVPRMNRGKVVGICDDDSAVEMVKEKQNCGKCKDPMNWSVQNTIPTG